MLSLIQINYHEISLHCFLETMGRKRSYEYQIRHSRSFLHCPAVGFLFAQVPHLINYQATVTRGGTNYHGVGHFKIALLDPEATRSYWSNDGTSVAASEPHAGVRVEVANGHYEVLLGDTSLTNMIPIAPTVFTYAGVHIRVWFSDGILPYQPVLPDQPIAAVGFTKIGTVMSDGDQRQIIGQSTPEPRYGHVAVWTGNGMLVFGGYETVVSVLPDTVLSYSLTKPLYLYRHP
jgi:hypothetical protein